MAEFPYIYTDNTGRFVRVYRCCNCKRNFEWTPDAFWYCSTLDVDNSDWKKIKVACSKKCLSELDHNAEPTLTTED